MLYKILRWIDKVIYELDLPLELTMVYLMFHVSMLRKFMGDPNSIMSLEGVDVEENFTYEEVPVEILELYMKRLRNEEVASAKVLWRKQQVESALWEAEADIMKRYPNSFLLL